MKNICISWRISIDDILAVHTLNYILLNSVGLVYGHFECTKLMYEFLLNFQLRPMPRAKSPCPRSQPTKLLLQRRKRPRQELFKKPRRFKRKPLRELMALEWRKSALQSILEGQKLSDPLDSPSTQGNLHQPGIVWVSLLI